MFSYFDLSEDNTVFKNVVCASFGDKSSKYDQCDVNSMLFSFKNLVFDLICETWVCDEE